LALTALSSVLFFQNRSMTVRAESTAPIAERRNALTALLPVTITIDTIVASGLQAPVHVTHAGDGTNRLFVVEQGGSIRIIKDGAVLSTPFLNISGKVLYGGEQGLLSVAFPPDYATSGQFYVYYTNYPTYPGDNVVARYRVTANPDVADPTSEQIVLRIPHPTHENHNGGQLQFGPDGYLYVGPGDGGSGGDPNGNGQRLDTWLGKVLRLDVRGVPTYTIPASNPFTQTVGARPEIWAYGLRNPWRFSFDRLTADLYIGDVGQGAWEEIDFQAAGEASGVNYGWNCREGSHTYYTGAPCNDPLRLAALRDPIAEYGHNLGLSVTGGYVYRGTQNPALQGHYFYADHVYGRIWSLYQMSPGVWSIPQELMDTTLNFSTFGEDMNGELYVADYSGGTIRRITQVGAPPTPVPNLSTSRKSSSPSSANPGEGVTYTIQVINTGDLSSAIAVLTDTVPAGLTYVTRSLTATLGTVSDALSPTLRWNGPLSITPRITITYRVTVVSSTGTIINRARLTSFATPPITLSTALAVPRSVLTTTRADFFFPGTQPNQLSAVIHPADTCQTCHTEPIYNRWRGSMMSQAGRDPLMWAALFIANQDAPNSGEYCLRCHTPKGWLEGHSASPDGSLLTTDDIANGVTCNLCHRLVDPVASQSSTDQLKSEDLAIRVALTSTVPISHSGSAMMIVDPQDRRRGPFAINPPPQHSAYRTDFLGQNSNFMAEARLCGTCHNVDNPVLSWDAGRSQYWPNGSNLAAPSFEAGELFPIETTFDEWANSQYATTQGVHAPRFAGAKPDGIVRTCQDCHMRRSTGLAADTGVNRDCSPANGCLPEHGLIGANAWVPQLLQDVRWRLNSIADTNELDTNLAEARQMLRNAATMTVTLGSNGVITGAIARVYNETGHKLPTGYPEGRRMWINLKAYNAAGTLVYESGAYNPATGVLITQTGTITTKVYEAKQGITSQLAAVVNRTAGESFHFVLNNTVIKDNRVPPRGFTAQALNTRGLQPVGTTYAPGQYWDDTIYILPNNAVRVVATLYYQTSSKEYIDFLRANGGVDGVTVGTLWDTSKSPPEVMALAFYPSFATYLPTILKNAP